MGLGFRAGLTYIPGHVAYASQAHTINAGEPWSAMDLADLKDFLIEGEPVEKIAEYLPESRGDRGRDRLNAELTNVATRSAAPDRLYRTVPAIASR
jgi:hypothetical protein